MASETKGGGAKAGSHQVALTSTSKAKAFAQKELKKFDSIYPDFEERYEVAKGQILKAKYFRSQMPVITSKDLGGFEEFLISAGVKVSHQMGAIVALKPTQRQVYLSKPVLGVKKTGVKASRKWIKKGSRFIVSRGNHIIDGHHRWLSGMLLDPRMAVMSMTTNIDQHALMAYANEYSDLVGNVRNESALAPLDEVLDNFI